MGLLTAILTFPVTGPFKGFMAICKQIADEVDKEMFSEDVVQRQLMELQLKYEMGEIDEETYDQGETMLLERLNEIMRHKESEG